MSELRGCLLVAAYAITAAVTVGSFSGVVVQVFNGAGWFYIAMAIFFFAAAWIVGKIADRKNKEK